MSPRLVSCPSCDRHVVVSSTECPHCGTSIASGGGKLLTTAAAAMLGLSVGACQSAYGVGDSASQAEYGVADTGMLVDDDGDGYSETDGDCDDANADIHPDAEETAGDGVDSNCDGEDDS